MENRVFFVKDNLIKRVGAKYKNITLACLYCDIVQMLLRLVLPI